VADLLSLPVAVPSTSKIINCYVCMYIYIYIYINMILFVVIVIIDAIMDMH
jgi:hypothetical protein